MTPPYGHAHTNYLPMNSFVGFIWIIWPWGQRLRSHEGHYGTRHTALWSCTHIPIIIDLSNDNWYVGAWPQGGVSRTIMIFVGPWPLTWRSNNSNESNKTVLGQIVRIPPCGHAPTYQLSLTYLERQKCYGPDKKILFKKQLFDLEVKGQGPTSSNNCFLNSIFLSGP
jgi:hypothetical protein